MTEEIPRSKNAQNVAVELASLRGQIQAYLSRHEADAKRATAWRLDMGRQVAEIRKEVGDSQKKMIEQTTGFSRDVRALTLAQQQTDGRVEAVEGRVSKVEHPANGAKRSLASVGAGAASVAVSLGLVEIIRYLITVRLGGG